MTELKRSAQRPRGVYVSMCRGPAKVIFAGITPMVMWPGGMPVDTSDLLLPLVLCPKRVPEVKEEKGQFAYELIRWSTRLTFLQGQSLDYISLERFQSMRWEGGGEPRVWKYRSELYIPHLNLSIFFHATGGRDEVNEFADVIHSFNVETSSWAVLSTSTVSKMFSEPVCHPPQGSTAKYVRDQCVQTSKGEARMLQDVVLRGTRQLSCPIWSRYSQLSKHMSWLII